MHAVNAQRRHKALPRDPAPSKFKYRYQRLMLTPGFRSLVRVGTPLALIAIIAGTWFANDANRTMLNAKIGALKASVQTRPEFMITQMQVSGADEQLVVDVQTVLPMTFPVSSFDLDLEQMRLTVEALYAVESARVKVGEGGALAVDVTPRVPVAVWRDAEVLRLIDSDGVFAGVIEARGDRLDLPLIAGDGAQAHIAEALLLFRTAGPVASRVRGLVRMGERRWDMVLDRSQRILLPEDSPIAALDRVIALNQAQDMLDRDVVTVDMRNGNRATLKMNEGAAAALRRISDTGN